MRNVVATVFVSLDGVMQAPGGPEEDPTQGFRFGGWTFPFWQDGDPVTEEALGPLTGSAYDLLLGRKTYEIFAGYWPFYDQSATHGGIAQLFNGIKKCARFTERRRTRAPGADEARGPTASARHRRSASCRRASSLLEQSDRRMPYARSCRDASALDLARLRQYPAGSLADHQSCHIGIPRSGHGDQ